MRFVIGEEDGKEEIRLRLRNSVANRRDAVLENPNTDFLIYFDSDKKEVRIYKRTIEALGIKVNVIN